ncbi:MAG: YfhO family protein, partial [Bacteroidales bacterium]|nr:YfhO family protein [Bacteroidales bacterium]
SPVFNMLNTRYFIVNEDAEPLKNPYACGNAWFVKDYLIVNNADEEIAALTDLKPESIAVIDKRFEKNLMGFSKSASIEGAIELTSYSPNHLVYQSTSNQDGLAVFSEIYYDKGWKAFIDGKEMPHFRANFILRAMIVPAGEHKIEFKFQPDSFYTGQNISLASSLILILLLVGAIAYPFISRKGKLNSAPLNT